MAGTYVYKKNQTKIKDNKNGSDFCFINLHEYVLGKTFGYSINKINSWIHKKTIFPFCNA